MVGMVELQLIIGGLLVTQEEMDTLVDRYPLIDCVMHMYKMGLDRNHDDAMDHEYDGSAEDEFEAIDTRDDAYDAS